MATSEIEKLERRYAENPQGLTFAPLAEVHRKNGDVARALELLKAGLELHPNYIPASIVLGRCHWDLGDLSAAESAFAHVLRLDDENVIALKSLADINERLERFNEAQRWLHRLVSVDRSNEEARQQLSRLETMKAQGDKPGDKKAAPSASAEMPHELAAAEPAPEKTPPLEPAKQRAPDPVVAVDLSTSVTESPAPAKASEPAQEKAEPKSGELQFLDTSEASRKTTAPGAPAEEPAPLAGLISQEFEPPKEAFKLHPELTQFGAPPGKPDRLDVELTEDVELRSSGADEFRMPNAAEEFMDLAAKMSTAREEPPQAAFAPTVPPEIDQPPTIKLPPVPVPETRATSAIDPGPAGRASDASKQSYSARETKGQSVSSFFEALLAARPPGNSRPPDGSRGPTTPEPTAAQDSPGPRLGETVPTPAVSQGKDGPVSFDDFFGPPAGGSASQPHGSTEPGKDDLDQFQSWLQNLKR
jgi:tetratricopeptide (TPR) repeat protein